LGGDLSHTVSLNGEAVGVVDEAIENGVGDGGIGNDLVPMLDRHLAGDDGRSALVAIIDDFEEIATLLAGEDYPPRRPQASVPRRLNPKLRDLSNDITPMHPEYPCAHCIVSGALASAIEAALGTVPEIVMTSPTAPGATHRWTNVRDYNNEVSQARIWAGFHYRFSTRVGQDMGRKLGEYVVKNLMQPAAVADVR
jgi:hypothetical protein